MRMPRMRLSMAASSRLMLHTWPPPCAMLETIPPGGKDPISVRETVPSPPHDGPIHQWRARNDKLGLFARSPYATHGERAELAISTMCIRACWMVGSLAFNMMRNDDQVFAG